MAGFLDWLDPEEPTALPVMGAATNPRTGFRQNVQGEPTGRLDAILSWMRNYPASVAEHWMAPAEGPEAELLAHLGGKAPTRLDAAMLTGAMGGAIKARAPAARDLPNKMSYNSSPPAAGGGNGRTGEVQLRVVSDDGGAGGVASRSGGRSVGTLREWDPSGESVPVTIGRDLEGRPIAARYVAGIRQEGGPDIPISTAELRDALATWRVPVNELPKSQLRRDLGEMRFSGNRSAEAYERAGNLPTRQVINLRASLAEPDKAAVLAHETGHSLTENTSALKEYTFGQLPKSRQAVIMREATKLSKARRPGNWKDNPRYAKDPNEIIADAVAGYIENPARVKAEAPAFAAWWRDMANAQPTLSRTVAFNQAAPIALLPTMAGPDEP